MQNLGNSVAHDGPPEHFFEARAILVEEKSTPDQIAGRIINKGDEIDLLATVRMLGIREREG